MDVCIIVLGDGKRIPSHSSLILCFNFKPKFISEVLLDLKLMK